MLVILGIQLDRERLLNYFDYMALMSELIEVEPSSFQEVSNHQVWRDSMVEEYSSIMKNSVWEVVP